MKKLEARIEEQDRMLEMVHILAWDMDSHIVYWNPGAEKMYGWSEVEVLGKDSHELLKTIFPKPFEEIMQELRRSGKWEGELIHTRKDLRRTYVYSNWALHKSGPASIVIEVNSDITKLKQTEQTLRQTRDYLESLFNNANAPIMVWDKDFKITRFNHAFEHLSGYQAGEVIGKDVGILFSEEDMQDSFGKISLTLGGEKWQAVELPILSKNGDKRVLLWNSANIFSEDGKAITATIAQGQDITERKEAEEILRRDKETFERQVEERTKELLDVQMELERSKRLSDIGALAATVAHELRNPLAAISMATSNIRRKAQNALLDHHIDNITKKVNESNQIINNLLFYSRLRQPHYENLDISDILEECVSNAQDRFYDKKVTVKRNWDQAKAVAMKADPTQMKELFTNILNNAYDAIPDSKGAIEIKAVNDKDTLKVFVGDNGSGIDKENLGRVFDPFFTTKARGTGLGLSVCYQIVTLHGGFIDIDSSLGKGTVVSVYLPKREK